ncbi:MAG: MFS transporter [Clostridiales bacterium]|nr:MFS transporter [Clostridiales bacterium]
MNQSQAKGFGSRGILLIVVLFLGFFMFQTFTNYPLNILADFYGGSQTVAMLLTIGTLAGVVTQIILSRFVGNIKSIKKVASVFGIIAVICAWLVAAIPFYMTGVWYVAYFGVNYTVTLYALFFMSIIAGQWFPRRKGTIMGISTIAYPVCNAVIGFFATAVFKPMESGLSDSPAIFRSFLPFLIITTIGVILFLALITDYPEQCGAYRDNDKSFTPEMANQMLMQEIEDKKTTVWTPVHTFTNRDFWCASIVCGLILMCSVGTMTQSSTIIANFPALNYTIIMMIIALCGAVGSWLLGIIDTAIGTKKSMLICVILMLLAGLLGMIACSTGIGVFLIISLALVGIFMGASSNYMVSVSVQYWRREDFASVFSCVNPVSNIFNAAAPTVVAMILYSAIGINGVFLLILIAGIIGVVLMLIFSPKHIKAADDKYREAAGKPLDDALAGRK